MKSLNKKFFDIFFFSDVKVGDGVLVCCDHDLGKDMCILVMFIIFNMMSAMSGWVQVCNVLSFLDWDKNLFQLI